MVVLPGPAARTNKKGDFKVFISASISRLYIRHVAIIYDICRRAMVAVAVVVILRTLVAQACILSGEKEAEARCRVALSGKIIFLLFICWWALHKIFSALFLIWDFFIFKVE